MQTEKILTSKESYSVNIAAGKVDSLRKISTSFTTVRAYDGGSVGVAGQIGKADESALYERARAALSRRIPYPCNLFSEVKTLNLTKELIAPEDYVKTCSALADRIADELPDFVAGNKINMEKTAVSYSNSQGSRLSYEGNNLHIGLVFKHKNSANIQDFGYFSSQNYYDEDAAVTDCKALGNAFLNEVALPDKPLPVITDSGAVAGMLLGDMIAETYCSGGGKLKGKLKQKIFSDKLTLGIKRNLSPYFSENFFDSEGTTDSGFKLIDGGVFSGLLTNKRSAAMFNLPLSASAGTDSFDSVPSYTASGLRIMPTANSVNDIARDGIYLAITSGGDVAADGTVGLPVQLAYLVEDGKLIGRLPQLTLTANIFDLLGGAYMGTAENSVYSGNHTLHDVFDVRVKAN